MSLSPNPLGSDSKLQSPAQQVRNLTEGKGNSKRQRVLTKETSQTIATSSHFLVGDGMFSTVAGQSSNKAQHSPHLRLLFCRNPPLQVVYRARATAGQYYMPDSPTLSGGEFLTKEPCSRRYMRFPSFCHILNMGPVLGVGPGSQRMGLPLGSKAAVTSLLVWRAGQRPASRGMEGECHTLG